jgi:hypothetical protein
VAHSVRRQQDAEVKTENLFLEAYKRNYVRAQYISVHMLAEHLADCCRFFGGDLQSLLIIGIVGQKYLYELLKSGVEGDFADGDPLPVLDNMAINATSLSAVTGIPRETVRRKLEELAAKGWIERDVGGWRIKVDEGQRARNDLAELDKRAMVRFAKLAADLSALVATSRKG